MDEQSVGKSLVHKINKLTVIASESYKDFVTDLQKQIKTDLYERPRKATVDYFAGKTVMVDGNAERIDKQQASMIYQYLVKNDYVTRDGNVVYHDVDSWRNRSGTACIRWHRRRRFAGCWRGRRL